MSMLYLSIYLSLPSSPSNHLSYLPSDVTVTSTPSFTTPCTKPLTARPADTASNWRRSLRDLRRSIPSRRVRDFSSRIDDFSTDESVVTVKRL